MNPYVLELLILQSKERLMRELALPRTMTPLASRWQPVAAARASFRKRLMQVLGICSNPRSPIDETA